MHGDLGARHAAGERLVIDGMRELGRLAKEARAALLARDVRWFAACLDGSLTVRARMTVLDPREARAAEIARAHGAAVNYAGSGGAVIGVAGAGGLNELVHELADAGWTLLR